MPIKNTVYFRNVYFTFAKFVKIFKQRLSFASKRAFCNFLVRYFFPKRINLNFFMFLKKDDMALTGQFFISPSVFAVRIICANNSLGDGSDPCASRRCACVIKIQRKTFVQFVVGILYFVHSFS